MRLSDFVYPPTIARCQHIKVNGVQCGSLALKNRKLCHFHQRWQQGRIQLNANHARRSRYSLDLPILEDANSIQVALMPGAPRFAFETWALAAETIHPANSSTLPNSSAHRPYRAPTLGDDAWYKEEFAEGADSETNEKPPNFPQNHRHPCVEWVPHPSPFSAEGGRQSDRTMSLLCFAPPYNVRFLIRSEGLGCSRSSPTPDAQET
jgi:hypothetical protein